MGQEKDKKGGEKKRMCQKNNERTQKRQRGKKRIRRERYVPDAKKEQII